jgi:hypothetical protein
MHDVARSTHRGFLAGAGMLACLADVGPAWGATAAVERELKLVVSVEATQDWKKNDPQFPGEQWSKATATQRWEIRTRLKSDGVLHGYDLLDPDLDTRMWAKTAHLARQAKKMLDRPGQPFQLPRSEAEKSAFMRKVQERDIACKGDVACRRNLTMESAAIMAAIQNPELLEPDDTPGRFLYFLPFAGCAEQSRVQLSLAIEGVRYNKTSDKLVPFSERRQADTVDASDGLRLCDHFLATIDTQDPQKRMRQETLYIPTPVGVTLYTESGHTSRTEQPQPLVGAALDWVNNTLRHAATTGTATTTLPLPLSLNGNSTWLGQWTGTAKVTMQWSFEPVTASGVAPATGR